MRSPSSARARHAVCRRHPVFVAVFPALFYGAILPAVADVTPQTMNGVPLQVVPTFYEKGLSAFPSPSGTLSTTDTSGTTGTGGTGTGSSTSSDALNTMMETGWGAAAAANAEAMGVNASALAATCLLESNCNASAASGSSSASGAFQMIDSTYLADIQAAAAAANPSANIDTSLAGKLDGANEAYAAAQELKTAALSLQQDGVANPTVLDVRGYYNFGGKYGSAIAQAEDSALMSDVLSGTSASTLSGNGITATTTVGEWRAAVTSKIGSAANQPVILG